MPSRTFHSPKVFHASDCLCLHFRCHDHLRGDAIAQPWKSVDPSSAGWSVEQLKAAQDYVASLKPAAVMVVQSGKVIASWGEVSRKVNVASVRKSLLSALYGIAISEGRIDLGSTLAEIGIDDKPPVLTGTEKQATVRDLLMARSGIYHAAAYETADIRQKRPGREAMRLVRSGSTTIGISTRWARSIGSRPARTFSGASRTASLSPLAWKISRRGTVDT